MDQTEALHVLASADRQLVLHELVERNGEVALEELSQTVAARRYQIALEKIDGKQVERARFRLVHTHLPKLVEEGIIHLNWDHEKISLRDGESVDQLFEASMELESWPPTDLLEHPSQSW